jgi:MFS family permease
MIDIWLDGSTLIALPIGLGIGLFLGIFVNSSYARFSEEQKRHWKENRLAHHYFIGLIALIVGIVFSPLIAGIGIGLIVTDLRDLRPKDFG